MKQTLLYEMALPHYNNHHNKNVKRWIFWVLKIWKYNKKFKSIFSVLCQIMYRLWMKKTRNFTLKNNSLKIFNPLLLFATLKYNLVYLERLTQ